MIRTRDFLLYILVFTFILVGISFTLSEGKNDVAGAEEGQIQLSTSEGSDLDVIMEPTDMDRAANIVSLRKKIEKGEGEIVQGDPIFTSVDTPTSTDLEQGEDENENLTILNRSPDYCDSKNTFIKTVSAISVSESELFTLEGARMLRLVKTEDVTVGSSTISTTTKKVILQMLQNPMRGPSETCIDSDIVGVALDGSLINNNETWRFREVSTGSTLIGYARDGFPIYSEGIDRSELDECGGYNSGFGYQYHIRSQELFVLGCFVAKPSQFIE